MVEPGLGALLIIDEVQKIPYWSDTVKNTLGPRYAQSARLICDHSWFLPWLMQKGLSESLAGRFENIPITHWSFGEMHEHFGWTLDQYNLFWWVSWCCIFG